jgi:hypothetical protein
MITAAAKRGERVLFVVHRGEIVTDIGGRLVVASCPMRDVTVATVQALARAKRKVFDLVVIDETHHYLASEWRAVLERAGRRARMVGFTATPQRSDGKAMGDVFETLVDVVSYSALLEAGHIVPCRVLTTPYPLDGALALHSVDAYQRYANGTAALVFERDVKAARASLAAFAAAGIPAELIVASTTREQREAAFARLRAGKTRALINVFVLTEGVDLPCVETIILARACEHAGTYVQIVGRSLRAAPGKTSALLIDLAGASYLHGEPTADRAYSLAGRPISETGAPRVPVVRGEPKGVLGLELVEFSPALRESCTRTVATTCGVDWDRESRLGRMPDVRLAKLLGVRYQAVRGAREARGIPPVGLRRVRSDEEWARETRLGKVRDGDLATALGVSLHTVLLARQRLGIPSYQSQRMDPWAGDSRLGKMRDAALARLVGVHKSTIAHHRNRLGIPACSEPGAAHG